MKLKKWILEGILLKIVINNVVIFSVFDGIQTLLYSIPIKPFFNHMKKNVIEKYIYEIKEWGVDVFCFNIPPDMSNLQ